MKGLALPLSPIRFGVFELNSQTGELRKGGLHVKLTQQVRKLLLALLEHPAQLCTREELRQRLWPAQTFVAFDHSLNKAVHELREVLGDSASNPRYVETVPGQGYRFMPILQEAGITFPPRTRAARRAKSVAVLPLEADPADPEMEFLNKKIVERIIDTLSQTSGLRLLAYNAVWGCRQKEIDPLATGRDLQVDVIAAGEMARREDRLLLHVELINVNDGTQVWGAQFREACSQALSHPERIADKITNQLRPKLTR